VSRENPNNPILGILHLTAQQTLTAAQTIDFRTQNLACGAVSSIFADESCFFFSDVTKFFACGALQDNTYVRNQKLV